MGHSSLVAEEGSQMAGLVLVIFRERLYFASMAASSLLGQEAQGAVTWGRKLTMRLK